MQYAIETFNLRKEYRPLFGRGLTAVDDLCLQVPTGSVFGFLGPNGAGKTTTIQMVLGSVYPTRGRSLIFGSRFSDLRVRRRVGFLPEKFTFHDFLTAEEMLRLHGSLAGMEHKNLQTRIGETLELVGLSDRRRSKIREFSKGMQQRIGLAQAIIHAPDLVVLDEPTSALDPFGRKLVRDVVGYLKDQGRTVFLNSHLLSEVEMSCDRVAIINQGKVIREGSLDSLLSDRSRARIELLSPSEAVMAAIRKVSPDAKAEEAPADAPCTVIAPVEHTVDIPALAEAIVSAGGKLMALQYQKESLEDFFIRTVTDAREGGN
jgi:ABC-2 type transport system ATP-binding protein